MKILLAEDDPDSRRIVKTNLLRAGYEVVEADDGVQAWELFSREPYPLIITDWIMPRMDGPELIQRIRASRQKGYTYIILLTSMGEQENIVTGLESGADEYLTKPLNSRELIARVASGMRILKLEQQLTEAHRQMEELAMRDALTGLWNRRAIEEHAEAEFGLARRKSRTLSIILLDIDHFKRINDAYGHQAGDYALQALAQILVQNLRQYDRAGRWGGEEFIVTLSDTELAGAVRVAERLRASVEQSKLAIENGAQVELSISLGVAQAVADHTSLSKLVEDADRALYRAKQLGRNRIASVDDPE